MEKNLKSLLVRLTKESCCTNKKIKPKLTKIKLNLNRKKKKLKPKQVVVKTKKQKYPLLKMKLLFANKNGLESNRMNCLQNMHSVGVSKL